MSKGNFSLINIASFLELASLFDLFNFELNTLSETIFHGKMKKVLCGINLVINNSNL